MKKMLIALLALAASAYAEYYTVSLTRVSQDLYREEITKSYVQTEYCYNYAFRDDAVLKYESYSYDNFVVFSDGDKCKVKAVFK